MAQFGAVTTASHYPHYVYSILFPLARTDDQIFALKSQCEKRFRFDSSEAYYIAPARHYYAISEIK
eukprot:scaffold223225_cov41-Prasinocladus_malaysianus.AAC.1